MRPAAFVALALLAATAGGCETFEPLTCDRTPENNPEIEYKGGTVEDRVYDSAQRLDGGGGRERLLFDGGQRFALKHELGVKPAWVELWLSFDRYDMAEDAGQEAQAAGNQAVLTGFDDKYIHVVNDSCAQYYLRVRAGASP
jgi:hypothetical protein